ncbi:alpha/beta hydrolase fold-3 domain-containing protein [Stachybotrys elegans]|uniref:Alpha/beta hydrolase fold-3 domain-containing protein n=1 Tax=Stachybotrys elegans TaxID=80388 RepID=A0A8K0T7A8_9HYPO|nr:alpha/beta hydrolase fold-3 domain-containing protein [Stachybotrys elegans]
MGSSERPPVWSYQPLKLLYQLFYFITVLARVPLWLTVSLVPALRPHPRWTIKQSFLTRLAYRVLESRSRIGVTEKLSLHPGKEGKRFEIIPPLEAELYRGPLLSSQVEPEPVGGAWFPRAPGPDAASKTVILLLHGGAFVQGTGREDYCGFAAKNMLEHDGADAVFCLSYRLSGYAGQNPFPAALQDTLAAYMHLLRKLKIPPSRLVIAGDSAGGNLVIALMRYIYEFGKELGIPPPRCGALFSPLVAPFDFDFDTKPQRSTDFLHRSFVVWGARTYAAGVEDAMSNPYMTPLGNPFPTPAPIFVNVGTAEVFLDNCLRWVQQMRQTGGREIELHLEEDAVHDTFLIGNQIGFDESARKATSAMMAFIQGQMI